MPQEWDESGNPIQAAQEWDENGKPITAPQVRWDDEQQQKAPSVKWDDELSKYEAKPGGDIFDQAAQKPDIFDELEKYAATSPEVVKQQSLARNANPTNFEKTNGMSPDNRQATSFLLGAASGASGLPETQNPIHDFLHQPPNTSLGFCHRWAGVGRREIDLPHWQGNPRSCRAKRRSRRCVGTQSTWYGYGNGTGCAVCCR
jgi:hypothetical protein